MKASIRNLLLLCGVASIAAVTTGCPTEVVVSCTSSYGTYTVKNYAEEIADITITGPDAVADALFDGDVKSYSLYNGGYRITAVGRSTGALLADEDIYLDCESSRVLTLTPAYVGPTVDAELDIANDTGEELDVYIDEIYQNTLFPGDVGLYSMPEGYHTVRVTQMEGATEIVDLLNQEDYWYNDTVTEWSITSTYPEVEIHNLLALNDECVDTFADTVAVQFDSGFYDVCPGEIGYFSLFHGDHLVEVFGQVDDFQFIDDFRHYPENTVTEFDIE